MFNTPFEITLNKLQVLRVFYLASNIKTVYLQV